jgi:RHS repeat-associated protein
MQKGRLIWCLALFIVFSVCGWTQAPEELNPPFCLFQVGHCTPGTTSGGLFYFSPGTYYYTPNLYFFTPGIYFFTPGTYHVFPDPLLKQDVDGVIHNLQQRRTGSRTDPVGSKIYQVRCPSSRLVESHTRTADAAARATPTLNFDGAQAGVFHFTTGLSLTMIQTDGTVLGVEFSGITLELPGSHVATGVVTSNGATLGATVGISVVDGTATSLVTPGGTCSLTPILGASPFSGIATFPQTDPVSTSDGELVIQPIMDLSLGGPLPLFLHRNYTSLQVENSFVGMLGFNWMTNFDPYILTSSNNVFVFVEGGRVTFQLVNGSYQMVYPASLPFQLIRTSTGQFRFFDPRQNLIFTFNSSGGLIRIDDRSGNALTVTQGTAGPTQVSDGLGRSLTFTYTGTKVSKVTDQTGRSFAYGRNGNLLASVTDPNGNTTRYSYESSFGITSITRPRGNVPYTQTYNGFGQVTKQTDSAGNTSAISLVSGGTAGLNVLTDSLGRTTTFSYPNLLDAASFTDTTGRSVTSSYDAAHRTLTLTDRAGSKTSIQYDPMTGEPAALTDGQGATTSFTWQTQTQTGFTFHNLAKVGYPDGTSKVFTYDATGNPLTITDRAGKTTTYTYNSTGQVLSETNASGGVTTYTYNADGTLATAKEPAANVTTYSYDGLKRLSKIQFADGASRSYTRDATDKIVSVTDERGNSTKLAFDANDNLQTVTDAFGRATASSYDNDDLPNSSTDRLGSKTSYQYDALGSLTAVTNGAGETSTLAYDVLERVKSTTDPAGKTTSYDYDAEGRLTSVTDPLGNRSMTQVDKNGRPIQYTTPLGESTTIAYDSSGRVTAVTDALGNQSTFDYDPRGLVSSIKSPGGLASSITWGNLPIAASVTDPNGNAWPIGSDSQGRITSLTDPLGRVVKFTYDARNRIASQTSTIDSVQFGYDSGGNPTQAQFSDGLTLTYSHDKNNLLVSGTGFTLTRDGEGRLTGSNGLAITRDGVGRMLSVTYATGKTVTYSYDPRGLLATVKDWTGGSITFTYDDAHRPIGIARSNGVMTSYTYDNGSNIASIAETIGSKALSSILLTRDAIGRVTSASRNIPQEAVLAPASSSFKFDSASQILGATYDAQGRMTNDNAGATYKWNAASNLISYSRPEGSATATYDGLGQRIARTSADGTKRNYIVNYGTTLPSVAIVQSGGADQTYYVYTPDGALLSSINASSGAHRFYSFDETGSTIFLTNDTGAITDAYGISPYGDVITSGANNSTDNPFTWQGKFGVMQDSGKLYYARFRYYDGATLRFLSPDPVFSPAPEELNPYQYSVGDPVANGDPLGLKAGPLPRLLFSSALDGGSRHRAFVDLVLNHYLHPRFPGHAFSIVRNIRAEDSFAYSMAYDPIFYNILLDVATSAPQTFFSGTGSGPAITLPMFQPTPIPVNLNQRHFRFGVPFRTSDPSGPPVLNRRDLASSILRGWFQ